MVSHLGQRAASSIDAPLHVPNGNNHDNASFQLIKIHVSER